MSEKDNWNWSMTEEEIKRELEEADRIMEMVNADPELRDLKPPADMLEKILESAREIWEQEEIENLSEGNKELIRLGKLYQKRKRYSRYALVGAAMLVALGLGSVSLGESKGLFSMVTRFFSGGDRAVVNSHNIDPVVYNNEMEVYEDIEKTFGFKPVRLGYLPKGISFQEATLCNELQVINLIYGTDDAADIIYVIRPNFRESSFGTTIDDKQIHVFQMKVNDVDVFLTEYEVKASGEHRWSVQFEYEDIQYWLKLTNMEQSEVEEIVNNLCFLMQ